MLERDTVLLFVGSDLPAFLFRQQIYALFPLGDVSFTVVVFILLFF